MGKAFVAGGAVCIKFSLLVVPHLLIMVVTVHVEYCGE